MLATTDASAQTKAEIRASKRMFGGRWVNKKTKRHLIIVFGAEGYAELNDWSDPINGNSSSVDAYKAWIKGGKLVMPESKTDLRSPYCEIFKKGNALIYRCMSMFRKDNSFVESERFVREKD